MNENINVETLTPITKVLLTIGELPTSYLMSMSYYEQVLWLSKYLQDKVIPVVNNNAEAVIELQNFVKNYFDNLDVQEEIDNKLDEMLEDGTLQEIIAEYLNSKAIFCFDNVDDMKQATNLLVGSYAKTLGYYEINDLGASLYYITDTTPVDTHYETLESGLYACLVISDKVNLKQLGAIADGSTDDSDVILEAISLYNKIDGNNLTYYTTKEFNVSNKIIENVIINARPYEATIGNTYYKVFNFTGNNNITNVSVNSSFNYLPSINVYAGETADCGLASNVHAFNITDGITNFYNCKTNRCWAFDITYNGKCNIYDCVASNSEMNFFVNSTQDIRVYNSKFNINKEVDSIYYHHIYTTQGTNTEFNNCEFTETGTGRIGNHYHGYSTSIGEEYVVSGKMVINNCNLKTTAWAGQLNCVDLIVNGGSIECALLLANGSYVEKPKAIFKNVLIKVNGTGNYPLTNNFTEMYDCKIDITSTGTKNIATFGYKVYNTIINCLNGTFGNFANGTSESLNTNDIILDNCNITANTVSWCYPYYATNFKVKDTTFTLLTTKTNSNPGDRDSVGYLYNCVFNNWTNPLNMSSSNTVKYYFIADNQIKSNIVE